MGEDPNNVNFLLEQVNFPLLTNDNLISTQSMQSTFSFDGEYVSIKSRTLTDTIISISFEEMCICVTKKENKFKILSINHIDYISFVSEREMSNEKALKIKNNLMLKEDSLMGKSLCCLTYIPLNKKSKCNCCKCFFCCECKCSKTYLERDLTTIYFLIKSNAIDEIQYKFKYFASYTIRELNAINRKRKVLFFVNPVSGTGISLKIWNKAKAYFDQTDLDIRVIFTERRNHAYDTVLSLGIDEYDGIINVSGDGILHEIINGILHREDRDIFINRVTVGALPAGSANGFTKAISHHCGEDNRLETLCYFIARGKSKKVDIQEMELYEREKKIYSFLSFTYGMIADIDLESEVCCGMMRTTIWGAIRWMCLRNYFGCLYYLPQDSTVDINSIPSLREPLDETRFIRENDRWNLFISANTKFLSEDIKAVPLAKIDDGFDDIVALKASTSGKCLLVKYLLSYIDNGDEFIDKDGNIIEEGIHYYKTKCWRFIPKENLNDVDDVNIKHNFNRFYSIDGESYPICPVQVKTIPKLINVYCLKD